MLVNRLLNRAITNCRSDLLANDRTVMSGDMGRRRLEKRMASFHSYYYFQLYIVVSSAYVIAWNEAAGRYEYGKR
jgi:ribosomal protein S6